MIVSVISVLIFIIVIGLNGALINNRRYKRLLKEIQKSESGVLVFVDSEVDDQSDFLKDKRVIRICVNTDKYYYDLCKKAMHETGIHKLPFLIELGENERIIGKRVDLKSN